MTPETEPDTETHAEMASWEEELHTRVDEILFYLWDPLNLAHSTWVRDEFTRYVPEVVKTATSADSPEPVRELLTQLRCQRLGQDPDDARDHAIAELIYALSHNLFYLPGRRVFEVD